MLERLEISIGCLLAWAGIALGIALLTISEFIVSDDLSYWGLAVLCLACTHSARRAHAIRDQRLREAFEMGQDSARALSSVH